MTSRLLGLAAAIALVPRLAAAGPPGAGHTAWPITIGRSVQDVVFFDAARPVLIRLHLWIDGKPFQAAWYDFVQTLFDDLDRDGDGVLSKEEAERAPGAQFLLQQVQGVLAPSSVGSPHFRELDTHPVDGKVTLDELASYYRRSGFGPIQIEAGPSPGRSGRLTDALFRALDLDQDGKLSRAELARAGSLLVELDLDDDELISASELVPDGTNRPGPALPGGVAGGAPAPRRPAEFLLITPGESPAVLIRQLLDRYDKDQDQRLSRAEIGLDRATFDQLDADHDGALDRDELAHWLERAADLEFTVHLGSAPGSGATIDMASPGGRALPLSSAVRRSGARALMVTLEDAQIDLRCVGGSQSPFENLRQEYLRQFQAADPDGSGWVDRPAVEPPQFQALRALFALADRDRDGKLTEAELTGSLDLLGRAATSCTVLTAWDHGRGLFELLDANHDGRLGQRELRAAWARLEPWDRDGDGRIARTEIPRQFELMVAQGRSMNGGDSSADPMAREPAVSTKGPLWFRKMDRNGDGDVSPREFIGTRADFRRIDTDGDGLIDAQEAERADAWFRAQSSRGR